jgi:hypothetical protein
MMPEAVGSVRRLLLSTSAKSPMHSPRPDLHQKVGLCEVGLDLGEKVPKYPHKRSTDQSGEVTLEVRGLRLSYLNVPH